MTMSYVTAGATWPVPTVTPSAAPCLHNWMISAQSAHRHLIHIRSVELPALSPSHPQPLPVGVSFQFQHCFKAPSLTEGLLFPLTKVPVIATPAGLTLICLLQHFSSRQVGCSLFRRVRQGLLLNNQRVGQKTREMRTKSYSCCSSDFIQLGWGGICFSCCFNVIHLTFFYWIWFMAFIIYPFSHSFIHILPF